MNTHAHMYAHTQLVHMYSGYTMSYYSNIHMHTLLPYNIIHIQA